MAALIDYEEISKDQYVELYEGGEVWIHDNSTFQDIKLDASAATKLFDFLLLHQDRLTRWAREMNKSSDVPPGPGINSEQ